MGIVCAHITCTKHLWLHGLCTPCKTCWKKQNSLVITCIFHSFIHCALFYSLTLTFLCNVKEEIKSRLAVIVLNWGSEQGMQRKEILSSSRVPMVCCRLCRWDEIVERCRQNVLPSVSAWWEEHVCVGVKIVVHWQSHHYLSNLCCIEVTEPNSH